MSSTQQIDPLKRGTVGGQQLTKGGCTEAHRLLPPTLMQPSERGSLFCQLVSVFYLLLTALYELSLFDAADAVAVDREYDVQQYKALLATVAIQRAVNKRPVSSGVKEVEEQKTNDEQQQQQPDITASPGSPVTNVCTFDLHHCGPPRDV